MANESRLGRIIELRLNGWIHAQIGAELGISRSRVGQILRRARTPEHAAELRARVHAKAEENRTQVRDPETMPE